MPVKEFEFEYNPVKESVNGQAAERVIWSTKAFKIAVDAIRKGLPLKANPFCGKNVQLLKPDLVYRRTQEEIDDYIKCKEDPVYFASKCFLMTFVPIARYAFSFCISGYLLSNPGIAERIKKCMYEITTYKLREYDTHICDAMSKTSTELSSISFTRMPACLL